jgi:hypothetical protein
MKSEESSSTPSRSSIYAKLSDETEAALVQVLLDKVQSKVPFKKVCDERAYIFGVKGTELRKKVQKRRDYLLANPAALSFLASKLLGISSPIPVALSDASEPQSQQQEEHFSPPPPSRHSSSTHTTTPSTRRYLFSPSQTNKTTTMGDDEGRSKKNIPTFELDFQRPWNGPCNGMIVIKGLQWEDPVTKQVVDKLSIYKPIFDIVDYQKGRYSARLSHDGRALMITEPVVADFLWSDPETIQKLVDRGGPLCQTTDRSYKIAATRIVENTEQQVAEARYKFPDDITCNNEFFNQDANGAPPGNPYKLVSKMVLQKRQLGVDNVGNPLFSFMPFVVWKVAIDGDDSRTSAKKDDPNSGLSDALSGLGINLGTNTNTTMQTS